jgi:hypothetical protein
MASVVPSRVVVAHEQAHAGHARKTSHGGTSTSSSTSRVPLPVRSSRRAVGALQLQLRRRYPAVRRRVGVIDQGQVASQAAQGEHKSTQAKH